MPDPGLIAQAKDWADAASSSADEYSGFIDPAKEYIVEHFGENGLIAAYVAVSALLLVILTRLAKITLNTIKYLIVPGVALALIASYFVNEPLYAILPVTITTGALLLLFKG